MSPATARRVRPDELVGHAHPRIAPPVPARSRYREFKVSASEMGIRLMDWQEQAARYITATAPGGVHLYREVCILVARQQGKTTLMKPHIIRELRAGRKVLHIAQNRNLPRQMFGMIADAMSETDADLFPRRRGKIIWPRFGAGQEELVLTNGGSYRIAASSRGGARGMSTDTVIIDELREMESDEVTAAAEPTLTMSADPQIIYLSNAGSDASVVLNAVRARAGKDEALAYLEWSAAPERAADDREGWAEANPALGHFPPVLRSLEDAYRRALLSGNLAEFETERLCRWVVTMRERLVSEFAWAECHIDTLADARRPYMAVSMDPSGTRASAAIAWRIDEDAIGLRLLFDVTGSPIDADKLGRDLRETALRLGVPLVGFDPQTDAGLAKAFRCKTEPISGNKFANATSTFELAVRSRHLRWTDAAQVTDDLTWTARKPDSESGSFSAVRANDDRPITAALASIRAVWLASGLKPSVPKVM